MKMVLIKQKCLYQVSQILCNKVIKMEPLKDILLKFVSNANVSWPALIIM